VSVASAAPEPCDQRNRRGHGEERHCREPH
jgi:hypothetical protein